MIRPKKHLSGIYRSPVVLRSRFDCLRMDKNEFLPHWPVGWYQDFLARLKPEHISIHPETGILYKKLGAALRTPEENLVITAGSDAAIKAAFEVFVEPGDEVIIPSPTFAMYYVYAQIFNAKLTEIHYDETLFLDVDAFLQAITDKTKLIAIANPNSPTGTVLKEDEVRSIIEKASRVGAAVLIDEAYYPFYDHSMMEYVDRYDNLIITRTFSKAAGMAGMRTGCLVSNREIAKLAFAVKPMYEITSLSVLLADYILDHYDYIFRYAEQVREGKHILADYFERKGLGVYLGHANFLHVDFGVRKPEIVSYLHAHDVLFKDYFDHRSLKKYSRFTVGPKDVIETFTRVFDGCC